MKNLKKSSLATESKYVFLYAIIPIVFVAIVVTIIDLFVPSFDFAHIRDEINIILTVAIVMFTAVEGYSTRMQGVFEERRTQIEDLRNELEKAYGPIYSILMRPDQLLPKDKKGRDRVRMIPIARKDKELLDNIMVKYPFMFPHDIVVLWRVKIRDIQ